MKFILANKTVRQRAIHAIENCPEGHIVTISEPKRSLEQSARMWAMLAEISTQIDWYGNKLTPEEWKDVFTASLRKQKVVVGIEGGFVVLGTRTSKMTKRELSDLMEIIHAFGAERGVKFNDVVKGWE